MTAITGEKNRRIIHNLLECNRRDADFNSGFFSSIFKKYGKFSPQQLTDIGNGLRRNNLPFDPADYKVTTETPKFRFELINLSNDDLKLIWGSLADAHISEVRAVNALRRLGVSDSSFDTESMIKYYLKVNAFTPKQLSAILYKLKIGKVAHDIGDFKITIRRDSEKEQLKEMEDWKVRNMWPALSHSQKKIYNNEYCTSNPIPLDFKPSEHRENQNA